MEANRFLREQLRQEQLKQKKHGPDNRNSSLMVLLIRLLFITVLLLLGMTFSRPRKKPARNKQVKHDFQDVKVGRKCKRII